MHACQLDTCTSIDNVFFSIGGNQKLTSFCIVVADTAMDRADSEVAVVMAAAVVTE